jgi:NAD(P)-dependent dehydrogenase (short-subunit alcohol dehydrogenase family)
MSATRSEHRFVLVTGASSGIGAACALRLDAIGFRVFAGVRSAAAAASLAERASPNLTPVVLDVTEPDAIEAAATLIGERTGDAGLFGLVNNAGIVVAGPLEAMPLDMLRRQLEVNVVGLLGVTQAMLPLMRPVPGRIINIGSDNGALAPPYLGAYAASKHALEAINDSLRVELQPLGVSVSIVEVGPTQTPIWEKSHADAERLADELPSPVYDLYRREATTFREAMQRHAATAAPPDRTVAAVVHALTSKRPRARYFPVYASQFYYRGMRFVPIALRDWLIRRALGLT